MTVQDQYVSNVRQSQEMWSGLVESFTSNLQKAFTPAQNPFGTIDPAAAIDQSFDFWEKALQVQREAAKQFVGATVAVGEKVRTQAESVGVAVREQGESVSRGVREQAESAAQAAREQAKSAQRAAREQAIHKYDELTKAELQEELSSRDLPKTGNVDELRERLIDDDKK